MNELFFRITLFVFFTVFIMIWLKRFFQTGFRCSSYYTANEGLLPGLSFRVLLALSIVAILLYLYETRLMSWSAFKVHSHLRLSGIPIGISGLLLLIFAMRSLGDNFFATLKLRHDHVLIVNGPYRYLKHPMYVSFIIIWICFSLLSANWFIGLTGLLCYLIIFLWRAPMEEKMMRDRFGKAYGEKKKKI